MTRPVHLGFTCWLTGLSGAGKSTLSLRLAAALQRLDLACEVLDGDIIRQQLSQGLGFSKQDRDINVLRVGFVCQLLNRNGINTVVAMISPYRETRQRLRDQLPNLIEVFVDCPIATCIQRDPKGLYQKALAGQIAEFTGISSPYEPPLDPEVVVRTDQESVEMSVERVLSYLRQSSFIPNISVTDYAQCSHHEFS